MIAMGIVLEPELLIADEPTTALDVTVQAQILELVAELKERLGIGVVLISHNLGVIADVTQRVMIMYAGRPAEIAPPRRVLRAPAPPLLVGPARVDPAPRHPGGAARAHRRRAALAHPRAARLRLPPALPAPLRALRHRPPGAASATADHLDACHLAAEDKVRIWAERRARFEDAAA